MSGLLHSESPASITAAESAELSARLAVLAKSGMPLEAGLRALAEEAGGWRLARVLRNLAARLEKGQKLEAAIAAPGCRLPAVLRGLIVAGIASGRLPEVLEEYAALMRRRQNSRRRMMATFAYPILLLVMIALLLILCHDYVAADFLSILHDFGTPLPSLTVWYFSYSGTVGWSMLGAAAIVAAVSLAAAFLRMDGIVGRMYFWIPFIGPVIRNESYVLFTRLVATLLGASVPLPDALRLTAAGMRRTALDAKCRAAAARVESGVALEGALVAAGFLETLVCFADWGRRQNDLPAAFRAAADVFEARAAAQSALMNMALLPLAYLFIVAYIGVSMMALILPILSLFGFLSGGQFFNL